MNNVIDKKRDKLFRKLIRPVIVGTAGNYSWQAVTVMKSLNKVIAAGLGG